MITRADIVTEARRWVGTPWHRHASLRAVGCDCVGLIIGVARELGIAADERELFAREFASYGPEPDPALVLRASSSCLRQINRTRAQPGDVLLFDFHNTPQHLGIQSEGGYLIHAWASARQVAEHRIDALWRERLRAAFTFPGIA